MNEGNKVDESKISNEETLAPVVENTADDKEIQNSILEKAVTSEDEPEEALDIAALEKLPLEKIVEEAEGVIIHTPKAASKRFKAIREIFYAKFNAAKDEAQAAYDESKNDESPAFVFEKEALNEQMQEVASKVKQAREEEKQRIEQEQKKNLEHKEALLTKLEALVEQDETLESINEVKEIQREWKTIRALPKDAIQGLWDRYHALQNRFYDNHSINIELKELDRQKNLEAKIELTKKVEALVEEKSLKRSFILLNKYHEEFKNIGPVPKESREPIWQAFKTATDDVYDAKRKVQEKLDAEKELNLEKKEILAEKAELVNQVRPEKTKDWNDKAKYLDDLFEDWKKIGPVPKSNKDEVWKKFNGVRNDFYTARKKYFEELNAGRTENLKAKEALCEKVEALKDSKDWATTSKEIIRLQGEWKKIGPVPDKVNQAIWKRFRGACDAFFNAKNEAFSGKREEETENLKKKEALIAALNELTNKKVDHKEAFAELKKINAEYRSIGFVPHKNVKKINAQYDEANKAVYDKYSKQIEEAKAANLNEHYKNMLDMNGSRSIEQEERNIKQKLSQLSEEIASIERNMSFFSKSKTAEKMLQDFNAKIEKTNKLIAKLKKELGVLKSVKRAADAAAKAEEAPAEDETTA